MDLLGTYATLHRTMRKQRPLGIPTLTAKLLRRGNTGSSSKPPTSRNISHHSKNFSPERGFDISFREMEQTLVQSDEDWFFEGSFQRLF